jgi:protein-disulfide isomerase
MPRKRTVTIPDLRLPQKLNFVPLLVVLLVIAAYLLGVLTTKVQYLEKGGTGTTNVANENNDGTDPNQPTGPFDVEVGHLPTLGEENAPVTVIEFSDFQCPFCKALYDDTLSQIKSEYVDTGKVRFAYRHYPLTSIHPNAQKAAEASECANEQGNFWGYHDSLFENQSEWENLSADDAQEKFVEFANELGLNGAQLGECVSSGKFEKAVQDDVAAGNEVSVNGTPATFVNGMLISGAAPFSQFKAEIDKALGE